MRQSWDSRFLLHAVHWGVAHHIYILETYLQVKISTGCQVWDALFSCDGAWSPSSNRI